ncbi:TetR family transcriptional regulator [Paenibacillus cellulosilyticus]|uniref:TetR family transcriptional regulator n=1 Tax=Paenibacillus cellulosilyticus TaxID=375489 RepID=A0A2V2YUD3_9BACL|nr:TetR/AcrR family transcriptional regulator [Paenibacillus cellulosilyticus]PWW02536.1 TetR family transcriptional regulator [Paenibacillus cellulosilyticus]QKS47233.1 TetR/AcrR family transcriptional regulator [Paenibacillus cellulosilyticus]
MNGFERRKSAIKEKMMNTVLEMLRTCEPRNIRIADIAAEADVSQVTIYNYFGNKEALIRESIKRYMDMNYARFEQFLDGNPTLKEIVRYTIQLDKETFETYSPAMFQQMLTSDPELASYIEVLYREQAAPMLVRMIEEGKKKGEIAESMPTATIMAYIGMLKMQSHTLLELAHQSGRSGEFMEEIINLFFYGIRGVEPSES